MKYPSGFLNFIMGTYLNMEKLKLAVLQGTVACPSFHVNLQY